ncbi:MAG: BREX system Lon protease-like protein BrxL [Azospirillum sp.]|nr:BREX system Lon protease-like protein BrxL [Azospirillum sp.]
MSEAAALPDALDLKLNQIFAGKVVRKDLLHRIKAGTNVPTFVLEFLLARYCASDDPTEIQEGMEAVLATLQENYVRQNESNAAQSRVAIRGKHKFIDKIHVRYLETEKRHWASLENFASQRIAIGERFYRDNERLLEGGIWAEVTIAHNDVDADKYAFYVEDVRPIQLSKFDFAGYCAARTAFSRDEWLDVVLRSVGLEPARLSKRLKFHFVARLAPLVEANFNFIELGPRGTGKSYFFSEFSPYSTLISGGQATKSILFYNNAKRKIGLVGYWDTVAFDEVGGIKAKDPDAIQIMKDYMANGRFSRGAEVIADASMAFVGNLDQSVEQIVNSTEYDLFLPLPPQFDLAIQDRFACYLPGWEMPKNSSEFLTARYGLITDYLAEAFHHQLKHSNRHEEVSKRAKLGSCVEGRDEKGIKKTLCAFLKMLHPSGTASDEEFDEYLAYAVESRRRVKEQMNKRKPDDEFARIDLSYIDAAGKEVVVYCPESSKAMATLEPARRRLRTEGVVSGDIEQPRSQTPAAPPPSPTGGAPSLQPDGEAAAPGPASDLKERHFTIGYGDNGHTYDSLLGPYLAGAKQVVIEDPYLRTPHQIQNFLRFCEAVIKVPTVRSIRLKTGYDDKTDLAMVNERMMELKQSLLDYDVVLDIDLSQNIHDREIRIDNGWVIKIGRGLDFYQKPDSWFAVGANDFSLRKCLETKVDIFHLPAPNPSRPASGGRLTVAPTGR